MSVNVVLNGVTYAIPNPGDTGWGEALTSFFTAIGSGLLQKSGGSFTLTSEVDFGATYGLKSIYFKSRSNNVASAGQIRLAASDVINFRNTANNGNLSLGISGSDQLTFNGTVVQSAISVSDTGRIDLTLAGSTLSADLIAGSVANSYLANMAASTIKGNNTGGATSPSDLTATQVTAMLNAFTGDSGSGGLKGLVPAPAAGDAAAGKFLKADGTWSTGGVGTVTSVSYTGDNVVYQTGPTAAVTGAGTLQPSLKTQSANTVLAGPTSGGAAAPTFRALTSADGVVPAGTVLMYGGSSAPTGWLKCDGTEGTSGNVSRTTYAALFTAIGTTYGAGDGSTTFGLPNFAGIFPRGAGSQVISSKTYTGTRGTYQGDQFQGHKHQVPDTSNGGAAASPGGRIGGSTVWSNAGGTQSYNGTVQMEPITDGTNGTPRTGDETRPANVGILFIIKT